MRWAHTAGQSHPWTAGGAVGDFLPNLPGVGARGSADHAVCAAGLGDHGPGAVFLVPAAFRVEVDSNKAKE